MLEVIAGYAGAAQWCSWVSFPPRRPLAEKMMRKKSSFGNAAATSRCLAACKTSLGALPPRSLWPRGTGCWAAATCSGECSLLLLMFRGIDTPRLAGCVSDSACTWTPQAGSGAWTEQDSAVGQPAAAPQELQGVWPACRSLDPASGAAGGAAAAPARFPPVRDAARCAVEFAAGARAVRAADGLAPCFSLPCSRHFSPLPTCGCAYRPSTSLAAWRPWASSIKSSWGRSC